MKKLFLLCLLIPLVGCTSVAFSPPAGKVAAAADQSLISGRLVKSELINTNFVFTSPLLDFHQKVSTLRLMPNGRVKSRATNVTHWDIGPKNTLRFYIVDELKATFTFDRQQNALVAHPVFVGKTANIKMYVAREQ